MHFRAFSALFGNFWQRLRSPSNKPFIEQFRLARDFPGISRPGTGPAPKNVFDEREGSGSFRKKAGAMHSEHSMNTGADLLKSISRPSGGKVAARSSRHPGFGRAYNVATVWPTPLGGRSLNLDWNGL